MLGVELLEDVGLELAVGSHRPDYLFALLVGGGLDQVGEFGRVQPPQLAERYLQAGRRHMGRRTARSRPSRPAGPALTLRRNLRGSAPAQHGPRAGVHPDDCQVAPTLASSISLALTRRAPSRWMR